jgi:Caspase domain
MLRHVKAAAAAASFFAIIACNPAFAENRVALVIGNSAYRAVTPLPNAQNDAKGMAELLGAAGFEVMATPDLSQDDLRKTIGEFAGKLAEKGPDTVALVFYAGHGIQVDGENFIVPVDVDPKREADIPLQAVRLNDLLNTLNSVPNKMRILMLDACRNNPFPAINQTTGKGLAIVDTKSGAPGTFISYSTSPGAEAEDGTGSNSPYTTALMKVAREPGLPIEEAFKRVRVSVNDATQGRQVPWESSSLTSDFRFFGSDGQPGVQQASLSPAVGAARASATRSVDDWKRELQGKDPQAGYQLVIAEDTLEAYQAYAAVFPQAPYTVRVKLLADRREEMVAWNIAVIGNTVASFRAFVTRYPGSDLAATARKLEDRIRNRSLNANAAVIPASAPVQTAAATPAGAPNATPIPPTLPTNVATAPNMCPCTIAPPPVKKKADTKPPVKRADLPPPTRQPTPPPRRVRPPTDEDIARGGPPADVVVPAIIGGAIIGGSIAGGMSRGSGGYHRTPSGGGYRPPSSGGQMMTPHYR